MYRDNWQERYPDFSILEGKTLKEIKKIRSHGDTGDVQELILITTEDEKYSLYHSQDCCESVFLYDICGDLDDVLDTPILLAEVVSGDGPEWDPEDHSGGYDESHTWTFYKLSTIKGSITLRWLGESNGWYSESVDFAKV